PTTAPEPVLDTKVSTKTSGDPTPWCNWSVGSHARNWRRAFTEDAMNHGPFDRSADLVAGVHHAEGGQFAGFRAAHAVGRFYAGSFTATPVAKTLSRAAHFQGTPVPVTVRLSGASGDPSKPPTNIVAMATKFYLPNGTVTDLIGITLPAFFARTPDEFLEFTEAKAANPATAEPDLSQLQP